MRGLVIELPGSLGNLRAVSGVGHQAHTNSLIVRGDKRFEILGEPEALRFDGAGELLALKGLPRKIAHAG